MVRGRPASGLEGGKTATRAVLLAAGYGLAAVVSHWLEVRGTALTPAWIGAGIAFAGLLRWGVHLWPAVWFAWFAAALLRHLGDWTISHFVVSALLACTGTGTTALAAWWTGRAAPEPLRTLRGLLVLVAAALLSSLGGATLGSIFIHLSGMGQGSFVLGWLSWWLGYLAGILVAAPPLLALPEARRLVSPAGAIEAAALLLASVTVATIGFGSWLPELRHLPLSIGLLPLQVWAALRFQVGGAAPVNLLLALLAIGWTAAGKGPFASLEPRMAMGMLQLFVSILSVTSLALGVALTQLQDALGEISRARRELESEVEKRTAELRHTLALQQATLAASSDGILVVSSDGRILSSNQRFREIWGLDSAYRDGADVGEIRTLIGRQVLAPGDFTERTEELATDFVSVARDDLRLRDGRTIERRTWPLLVDGVPVGRVWSYVDVTDRIEAQQERERLLAEERHARVEAEHARWRASYLAEATRTILQSLDETTLLRKGVALAMAGGAEGAAIHLFEEGGPVLCSLVYRDGGVYGWVRGHQGEAAPEMEQRFTPGVQAVAEADRPVVVSTAEGNLVAAPIVTGRKRIGVLSALHPPESPLTDVTRLLLQELAQRLGLALENARLHREAQEAIRLRDEFLSIASHELKTPLATLRLQLQRLRRHLGSGDPAVEKAIASIIRQNDRMNALIDDLLDLSRITSNRISLVNEPLDLAAIVAEMLRRFQPDAEAAGSPMYFTTVGETEGRWDRMRLEQVISNLLSNAIKYGRGEPIEVRLEGGEATVRLSVRDHGIGISPEEQARIFERFERAVPARRYGGVGLGLWITRQLVEAAGGTIRVESEVGKGSTFIVELPRTPPAAARTEGLASAPEPAS